MNLNYHWIDLGTITHVLGIEFDVDNVKNVITMGKFMYVERILQIVTQVRFHMYK